MNAIQQVIIQSLVKLLTPSSPAYGNTLAFERPQTCQELKQKLQPGDVIFSRTNNFLYEVSRRFMEMKYDHVAVIINNKEVIHISPPIISKIDMEYIMNPSREPLIIRPNLEDKQKFLTVIQNFLGEKYNLSSIPKFAMNEIKRRLDMAKQNSYSFSNLKYSRICSDAILYSLCRGSEKLKKITQEYITKGKFKEIGCFLPDEVAEILLLNNSQIILKSSFQKQYKIIEMMSKGEESVSNTVQRLKNVFNVVRGNIQQTFRQQSSKITQNIKIKNEQEFALQIFKLIIAIAQFFIPFNSKIHILMIMINLVMIIGHIGQIKNLIKGDNIYSKL